MPQLSVRIRLPVLLKRCWMVEYRRAFRGGRRPNYSKRPAQKLGLGIDAAVTKVRWY